MPSRRLSAVAAAATAVLAASAAPARAAEALHGITAGNDLVTFHSDSPGAMRAITPVTGLAPGERLVALDLRPRTGQLYALASSSRLYTVNPISGAATAVGGAFTPLLAGTSFGMDVDGAADRLRVVSDGRQNLRLNPEDGQVAGHDAPLAYAAGDEGEGSNPGTGAAAFTRPLEGQPQLLLLDTSRDVLATAPAPAQGQLTTVGALGVDLEEPASFEIAADGSAWVVARRAGSSRSELFLADTTTGAVTDGAKRPGVGVDAPLVALTAAGPVPDDATRPSVLLSTETARTVKSARRAFKVAVSCSEPCSLVAKLQRGKRVLARGDGELGRAGRTSIKLEPTAAARRLAKRGGSFEAVVRVTAGDAAANHTRTARKVRFG